MFGEEAKAEGLSISSELRVDLNRQTGLKRYCVFLAVRHPEALLSPLF